MFGENRPSFDQGFNLIDATIVRNGTKYQAGLIKKVYEANPLICPRCNGPRKIMGPIPPKLAD